MRGEFERMIDAEISAEDYTVIEMVYNWHPRIPNVGGKQLIAQLYQLGGMELMQDMYIRAKAREEEAENLRIAIALDIEHELALREKIAAMQQVADELAKRVDEAQVKLAKLVNGD